MAVLKHSGDPHPNGTDASVAPAKSGGDALDRGGMDDRPPPPATLALTPPRRPFTLWPPDTSSPPASGNASSWELALDTRFG